MPQKDVAVAKSTANGRIVLFRNYSDLLIQCIKNNYLGNKAYLVFEEPPMQTM